MLLLLMMVAPSPVVAETSYFAVVNYTVYPFDSNHRPWLTDKGMLLPHTVLTGEGGSENNMLGLRSMWSAEDKYFTLYNGGKQLTFAYGQSTAFSGSERYTAYSQRTFDENGTMIFYIPIDLVCEVFSEYDFIWSEYETEWGTMVRVSNGNGPLSNELFVKNRSVFIKDEYDKYVKSITPTPGPSPTASQPPVPVASPSPSAPEPLPVTVYLTFDGAPNDVTGRILDKLEKESLPAIFFLPPDHLADYPDLTRRIAARHEIGLLIDEPDGEVLPEAVRLGNELLRETVFAKTWLLRAENAPYDALEYRNWGYTLSFGETDSAQSILDAVTPLLRKNPEPSAVVLSLPHSEAALEALSGLISQFSVNDNIFRRINPGEFAPV